MDRASWVVSRALPALALVACAAPADPPPTPAEASAAERTAQALVEAPPEGIEGHLGVRYRGRSGAGAQDHDLYTTLYADAGAERAGEWSTHLLGSAFADLDGAESGSDEFVFFSLADTYDGAIQGELYHLHADYHGRGGIERLRLGRQLDYATPELAWFDGASLALAERGELDASGGLYGGVPVHAFESSSEGDVLFGLWGQAHPWKGARLRLDWMHLEDEFLLAESEDDLVSLSAWQTLSTLRLQGALTGLEGEPRDLELSAAWVAPEQELALRASFYRLLEEQRQQALELDPFTASLFELAPYDQSRFVASRSFGDAWSIEGGFDLRRVEDRGDEGQFNRDFDRYFLTVASATWLPWELEASLTVDAFDGRDDDLRSVGGDLTRAFGRRTEAGAGTYYSLFEYDLYQDEERDDVRTYFARLRREIDERRTLDLRYEYEDDERDYHTLRVGTTWRF